MEIIITKYFEKYFTKRSKDLTINELLKKINIESKNFIWFSDPYFKVKINSSNKTYRLIVSYDSLSNKILLINIFDKKDKKYWENISWELHKNNIIEWRDKNIESIIKWDYYKFFT